MGTNVLTKQQVFSIILDVLEKEGILDAELHIDSGSEKCDGFVSAMTKVSACGKDKTLHIIIKRPPEGENFRKLLPVAEIYGREIYFYNTVVPAFFKFQADRNVPDHFKAVPKCFKTTSQYGHENLLLENIREIGFDLWNRRLQMDDEHVRLVLKEYAKFHAISFAMQDQDIKLYEELTKDMDDIIEKMSDDIKSEMVKGAEVAADLFCDQPDVQEKLLKFRDGILPLMEFISQRKTKYNAILHGDCWSSNMMFKYECKKPVEVCLLDFQLVRASTPVLDIAYFYYACASRDLYDNWEDYLKFYHSILTEQMKAMGSDANKLYPYSALMDDWMQFARFGYMMGLNWQRIASKTDDMQMDINDVANDKGTFSEIFKCSDMGQLGEKMKPLTMHMINNGFLS